MKRLKKLLPVMLLALLAWNCQKEEASIPQESITGATAPSTIQKIDYRQLPLHIRDEVSHSVGAARGKGRTGKGGEPFGDVRQDRVDVMETDDGTTSYTLGMEKLAEGAYMDRLVVTEDVDGRLSTHILRYRPSGDWLARRASGETGWEAYTGEIAIFDGEGDPKAAGHFDEGQVTAQATGKGKAGKSDEMDCTITDISMGGVQQGNTLYVTDIIIEYECSGSGTNDGDDDPDPGLDNGGGEFPNGGEPHGGSGEQIPTVVNEIEEGLWHTACRSFEYAELGNTGIQVAAANGISHPVVRGGNCPGAGYVFPQSTYYFSLPIGKARPKRESTIALEKAFDRLQKYFKDKPCTKAHQITVFELALKLEEYIKSEFTKIGGQASKYPPLGWSGEVEEYETNVGLTKPDC